MDSENHREKRLLVGLMNCIFNAAANTEKMLRTGSEPKKSCATNLSQDQRKLRPPKPSVARLIDARR